MVAAAEAISTPESRERFLHSGLPIDLCVDRAASPRCFTSEVYPDDHSGPTVIGMVKNGFNSQGGKRGSRRISIINGQ